MRTAALVLLPALLAAGCVGAPDLPAADLAPAKTLSWALEGCAAAVAVVPVPAAALVPWLPEGFRPIAPAEAGLPADPRGDAILGLEAFECATATAGNSTVEGVPHGGIFTFVEPPAELADPDVDFFSFFRWDTVLGSETMRAHLAQAGAPVFEGTATVETAADPASGGPLRASLEVNGTSFQFTGGAQAPSGSTGGVLKEYFATPAGLATWKARGVAPYGQGAGTIQATGGLAEEVLGAQPVAGYVLFMSDLSFVEGTVTVP